MGVQRSFLECYYAFQWYVNSRDQKQTNIIFLHSHQPTYRTSQETELHFNEFKCSWLVICDCCVSVSQGPLLVIVMLWLTAVKNTSFIVSWLSHANFRVRMLSKSAVKCFTCIRTWVQLLWYSPCRAVCLLFIWSKGIKHGHLWGRLERRYMRRR